MPNHTVKPGEHLAQIALDYGFTNFKHIFDLGENAELKAKRKTPHILAPGDKVWIPEPEPKVDESAATEKLHTYKVTWDKLKLRLVLRDQNDKPVKGQKCALALDSLPVELKTDGAGLIEREIPHHALEAHITARNDELAMDLDATLHIGGLDPVDTITGQIGRLNNLGYDAGDPAAPPGALPPPDKSPDPDAALRFRSAVEEFQCDHGLSVDGKCGPNTQSKLKEVHGC